ncbi:hypothetical protein BST81_10930 [Leptolyngbya sp. 'hensonii']|uniref:hypothetical protein n=1 Tax=Leptolyngbya sp. 'hensonii' TaxID=1922337 RepID=UPI00094F63A7|nr:hypothetical protein [Leptolyngbya sp. 'hensonii']OLP18387.1 hypothetical protein BST81_10930 [Leptolyngbya sp. 'hensonii']
MITAPAHRPVPQRFEFVHEWDDQFLQLFPHRDDYLWAEHPDPGKRPEWKTESRYPLSDRTLKQGAYLFGVRFGAVTTYLMLDIDIRSYYHPQKDPFAIWHMIEALEPLGLVQYVAVTSSSSGGLHLYFPFEEAQASWAISLAAKTLLENKGFKLLGGQLEIFPNPKPYSDVQTNYQGHRLPLQNGSYLLNDSWETILTNQTGFVQQWHFAERRNDVSRDQVERVIQTARQKNYSRKLKASGQKYYSDLCRDIKDGFTGSGQTQHLFAKVANQERVFYHALHGGSPLEGEALAHRIAEVVRSLPGFGEYCGHQHEIDQLAKAWARAAEHRYYPYGSNKPLVPHPTESPSEPKGPTWNEQQAQEARERIKQAIANLLDKNALPAQATARRKALRTYGVGNTTLDKNRDLWHPEAFNPLPEKQYHPIESNLEDSAPPKSLLEEQYHPIKPNKLLPLPAPAIFSQGAAGNSVLAVGGSGGFSTGDPSPSEVQAVEAPELDPPEPGPGLIREILGKIAIRSQQVRRFPRSILPPPDENYFRQLRQQSVDNHPGPVQEEFVQQVLDLSGTNPYASTTNCTASGRDGPVLEHIPEG